MSSNSKWDYANVMTYWPGLLEAVGLSRFGRYDVNFIDAPDSSRGIQLPVPYATKPGLNGGTAIPLPATVMVTRRCPPDKVRPLPPTPNQQTGLSPGLQKHTLTSVGGLGSGLAMAGNGGSPLDGNSLSGSPQHHHNGGTTTTTTGTLMSSNSNATTTAIITQIPKGGVGSSLRQPQATTIGKIPSSPYSVTTSSSNNNNNHNNNNVTLIPNGNVVGSGIPNSNGGGGHHQKQSMLDKLKLFNSSKEKHQDKTAKSTISKRTSSSSGFSSARSERSDSSLSLNDGISPGMVVSSGKIKESSRKSEALVGVKSSSKSSKVISSKSGGGSAKISSKLAKKDQQQIETHIPITPKSHKIPTAMTISTGNGPVPKNDAKLKPAPVGGAHSQLQSGGKKLETKSESKTSLLSQQQQQLLQQQQQMQPPKTMIAQPTVVGTGIPKPMAAVKGTSKPSSQLLAQQPSKEELSKMAVVGLQQQQHNGLVSAASTNNISNNNVLGSPLKQQPLLPNCMTDSMHSNSTQGASMGQHSNSSESGSSVMAYRPSGSDSGSSEQQLSSPQKPATSFLYSDVNLNTANNLNNNNNNNKFNTVPTNKILNTDTIYEQQQQQQVQSQEDKQMTTVVPMRPLLRGYNSHVTLPTRGNRGHHHYLAAEYCEDLGGPGGGYCSDGDALRKIHPARYSDSMDNGYLSEGGGGGGVSTAGLITRQQYISALRNRTPLPTTIEERQVQPVASMNKAVRQSMSHTQISPEIHIPHPQQSKLAELRNQTHPRPTIQVARRCRKKMKQEKQVVV
ncbi:protein sickie-like [Uranotaenia lowii]|uniref:protein sickie-like n=1 Tax=Uranotaenia lowii TaxID=190385 RepID=UPI00247ACA92|nr:protein sickie-like [Uranotaenia lowii]